MRSCVPIRQKVSIKRLPSGFDSDGDEKLKYFNKEFKDSDMSSQNSNEYNEPLSDRTEIKNDEIKTKVIRSNYDAHNEDISKKYQANERTLFEIGFKTNEISEWDQIKQPPKEDLLELLIDMIKNFKKTDVKIIIGTKTFNCHMIVLRCYSEFFMKKVDDEHLIVLPEDQVTSDAFAMIYGWMLSEQPKVKRELILELFNAATFLSIKGILDQCWACLDDGVRFREDTAFMLYLEAGKYKHDLRGQIQQLMLTRICKFFLTLVSSKEFLEMTSNEVCTLLESNTIGVYSETEVLMAGVRWLHFDFLHRQKYIADVIKCVRFGLMAPWQLVELKRSTTCYEIQKIVENIEVQNMIDDGLSYVTTKYYYGNREDEFLECLKRLNLHEPVERQWICDKSWTAHERCLNKQIITYEKFSQYLEYIRNKGKDHWKELQFNEHGPYADYHLQVRADDKKYFEDYTNIAKIIKN